MLTFTWITLGLAALLLLASAACWGVHVAIDDRDWRRLGIKVFRFALVVLLFYVNAAIYGHLFGVFDRPAKPLLEELDIGVD